MRAGSLSVACLADVPDGPILGRNTEGILAAVRIPEPAQPYRHHLERLVWWMRCSPTMACVAPFPRPISKPLEFPVVDERIAYLEFDYHDLV
jgi:hypothetical protein